MTTLSPFLKSPRAQTLTREDRKTDSLNRVVSLLLQGISLHTFQFDPAVTETFQISIRKLRSQLELVDDEDSALLMAGAAIRLLEENNEAAEAHLHAKQNELEKVIALLSDALLEVSGASEEKMVQVKEIERDIAAARGIAAMAAGRARMASAAEAIREAALSAAEGLNAASGEIDGVTGLPDSVHGSAAISEAWGHRSDYYVAIFAAERLDAINTRFGFEAGDQVLQALSQHVTQQAITGDQLFRWRGPCVMSLMRRRLPEAHVLAEMTRTGSSRLEHSISIRDRDAIVSVSTAWQLIPLSAMKSVDAVIGALDQFAATRARCVR
ncbi:MAG TPA: GGDEF domain-containing protein [Bryobacteraceae bacterium]|nr:GGDEF domain-containing protein [Bryobacteraceae bacterium]